MTDNLKERLLTWHPGQDEESLREEALARITELEARLAAAEAGEDALAELLRPLADENPLPTCNCLGCRVAAALAAYEARRKG